MKDITFYHLRLVLAFLLAVLAACSREPSQDQDGINDNNNASCDGSCMANYQKAFLGKKFHIEIEPTYDLAQVFYSVDPGELQNSPLILSKVISIKGSAPGAKEYIEKDQNDKHSDILGPYSDIIALPIANKTNFLSPRIASITTKLKSNLHYDLNLLAGLSYAVILNPNGSYGRAPLIILPKDNSSDLVADFSPEQKSFHVKGRITSQGPAIFANTTDPFLKVGVFQGTRLISSVALLSGNNEFDLEVSPTLLTDAKLLPLTLVVEPTHEEIAIPSVKKFIDEESLASDFDVGEIDLGQLNSPFSAKINIRGSDHSKIPDAILYLKALIGKGEVIIKKQADKMGTAVLNHLYEGKYDIAIIPPYDSNFAIKVVNSKSLFDHQTNELSFNLSKRKSINAQVIDEHKKPVNGAQVELSRIGKLGGFATEDIFNDIIFKINANTNEEGMICHRRFGFTTSNSNDCDALTLDEGRYLAHVTPPAGSQLAHSWTTFDFSEQKELVIELSHPQILRGQVIKDDKKTPLTSAFVTIYQAQTNIDNQPRIIGNALTDDQGFFEAFVPVK